jgi:hypothetical protein
MNLVLVAALSLYKSSLNILKISSTPAASVRERLNQQLIIPLRSAVFSLPWFRVERQHFPTGVVISILKRQEENVSFSFG